jgi:hypothetical protein
VIDRVVCARERERAHVGSTWKASPRRKGAKLSLVWMPIRRPLIDDAATTRRHDSFVSEKRTGFQGGGGARTDSEALRVPRDSVQYPDPSRARARFSAGGAAPR